MANPLDGPLAGTAALVTGASSGIGEQTAVTLAGLGADVAVAARRVDRLDALVKRIDEAGGRALAVEADVTDEDQARAAVAAAVETFGRLDTVVANAGVMLLGPLVDADTSEWRRMIELNTLGAMYTAHAALPHLLAAGFIGAPCRGGRQGLIRTATPKCGLPVCRGARTGPTGAVNRNRLAARDGRGQRNRDEAGAPAQRPRAESLRGPHAPTRLSGSRCGRSRPPSRSQRCFPSSAASRCRVGTSSSGSSAGRSPPVAWWPGADGRTPAAGS